MTIVRELLDDLPPDERAIEAAEISKLGINLEAQVEEFDEITTEKLREFFLRRRDQLKRKVALLKRARKKRQG